MRLQQLHLLRYGKFTDQALSFPRAARDFHLTVGANEAGKSTIRSAILDLLYGIETRSTFDFLHANAEMRLGATLEHDGAALEFVRTKARIRSLFGASGGALAESALTPFLAGTDRACFDQMFGLDHARMEAGSNAILSASDDIGQILFQSAAGIGSLGHVRDRLEAEADKLWARRRSGDWAHYIASDKLARAEAALKTATVRTKDWTEARARVQELEERRELSRGRCRGHEAERIRLERVRRVAPALRQLREWQSELRQLAGVVLLPPDAARQLADTELELAGAERDQQLYADQARQSRERLESIRLDERALKHEADILALAERWQQVRNHERDIERRQSELNVHWQQVEAMVRQLGWPAATEPVLADRLPALPARSALAGLSKQFGVRDQARQTASAAVTEKAADRDSVEIQLEGLSVLTAPPALRVALAAARALGDLKAGIRRDAALVSKCTCELASALAGLGHGSPDPVALRALVLPSEPDVGQCQERHADLRAVHRALADKHAELDAGISAQEPDMTQYRNAHHPVSAAELADARAQRDAVWRAIKSADEPVQELAPDFEAKVGTADSVFDQRHDKAREVSELQSRIDALECLRQQAADHATRRAGNDVERAAMDTDWARLTAALGLAGLPLHEFEPWRAARDKALRAQDALIDAQQALQTTRQIAHVAATSFERGSERRGDRLRRCGGVRNDAADRLRCRRWSRRHQGQAG